MACLAGFAPCRTPCYGRGRISKRKGHVVDRKRKPCGAVVTVAVLVAAAAFAPAAGAKVKLTGVVAGQEMVVLPNGPFAGSKQKATIVSVRKGSKRVGRLVVGSTDCGGNLCQSGGRANLTIGSVKGDALLSLDFRSTGGCFAQLPTCRPAKFGSGKVYIVLKSGGIKVGVKSENIRVDVGKVPTTNGSKFGLVLG